MVHNLAQLHQDIGNLLVYPRLQIVPGLRFCHELVVEKALAFGQWAHDEMFKFAGQLLLNIALQPAEQIRS